MGSFCLSSQPNDIAESGFTLSRSNCDSQDLTFTTVTTYFYLILPSVLESVGHLQLYLTGSYRNSKTPSRTKKIGLISFVSTPFQNDPCITQVKP